VALHRTVSDGRGCGNRNLSAGQDPNARSGDCTNMVARVGMAMGPTTSLDWAWGADRGAPSARPVPTRYRERHQLGVKNRLAAIAEAGHWAAAPHSHWAIRAGIQGRQAPGLASGIGGGLTALEA